MLAQINMAVSFKQLHEFRYDPDCLITSVIIPKPDTDVVLICAIRQQVLAECIQNIFIIADLGFSVSVTIHPDTVKHFNA